MIDITNNEYELYHHGIKGQKWGVRRTPQQLGHNSHEIGSAGLMLANVGMTLAVVAAVDIATTNRGKKYLKKALEENDYKSLDDIPKITKGMTDDNVKKVNPGYPKIDGTTNNCMLCTTAMVLREKGYDVMANTTKKGFNNTISNLMFDKNGRMKYAGATANKIINKISSEGDGAYGAINVIWGSGSGGHSMFWKNTNGSMTIYDGQTGDVYKDPKEILRRVDCTQTTYSRLDNSEPTQYALGAIKKTM